MPVQNVAGVGDAAGPDQWFKSLPIITQYWFGATGVVTLAANFGIVNPYLLFWSWNDIRSRLELWRFLTPFCFAGPFDFSTLMVVYLLVQFSKQYELGGPFNTGAGGGTADYAFCLLLGAGSVLVTYPLLLRFVRIPPTFCRTLIYYVLYIWSKRNPTAQANIWGIPMAAIYLPFAYLAFSVFTGQSYMDLIHGMSAGHVYYFLVDVVPMVYGKDLLRTPQFLINYFGTGQYQPQQPMNAAPRQPAAPAGGGPAGAGGGGHNWGGGGRALGRN
eukprot:Nitzschia sp. Nitz4//scaffold166_size90379//53058//53952//NITZ4_005062-RA/size90379-augustus-gene-0.14-mRNA-1//-1//CDS//3329538211//8195//frame0